MKAEFVIADEYVIHLDAIDAIVVEPSGATVTLRSGRTLFLTERGARRLFEALGVDLDAARLVADEARTVEETWDVEEGESWES